MSYQASAQIVVQMLSAEQALRNSYQRARVAGVMLMIQVPLLMVLNLTEAPLAPVNAINALGCVMLILSFQQRSWAVAQLIALHAEAEELAKAGAWDGPLLGSCPWPSRKSWPERILEMLPLVILFYSLLLLFWTADLRQAVLSLVGASLLLLVCWLILNRTDREATPQNR